MFLLFLIFSDYTRLKYFLDIRVIFPGFYHFNITQIYFYACACNIHSHFSFPEFQLFKQVLICFVSPIEHSLHDA